MSAHRLAPPSLVLAAALASVLPQSGSAANAQILAWNNLGMHCMDSDYSVFSILPPYNTIECQLIVNGLLVTNGTGYTVKYQAIADPSGSFNSTAMGKGNFYTYSGALYGKTPAPEMGLGIWGMPGTNNTPQTMLFEQTNNPAAGVATPVNWFRAEGIPISPYDDSHAKNPYPMMRLTAWNSLNQPIATNDIVLPVSDEMDCRACHATGSYTNTLPMSGWVSNSNPELDYRLNILRLHDEKQFAQHNALYVEALAARGFNAQGLYQGVVGDGKPVLCAACHASEALGAPSYSTIPPLTASVHGQHASAPDPTLLITLDNSANRAACYRCHPGSTTRCLRGAMGGAVAADGSMEMQCQSCHGSMTVVGSTNRVGWFMEPTCQSCHSGTAAHNNGQIRYTSVFTDANFTVRAAVDQTFATQPGIPAPGISLYRFSAGHGSLQCEACHGSTHAEFPSTHRNDNIRNLALQSHVGMMIECLACHTNMPNTPNGGPHGMHAIGQGWVSGSGGVTKHADWIGSLPGGVAACQPCHGMDYRGTVLSRAQASRTLTSGFDSGSVTLQLFRGATIGCYNCHNGPANDNANTAAVPVVGNIVTNTMDGLSVAMTLPASGTNLSLRIISQPANGTVGLNTNTHAAVYFPDAGFTGTDTFTFAAYNGSKNSILATGTVVVATSAFTINAQPLSRTNNAGTTATFTVATSGGTPLSYRWSRNSVPLSNGGNVSGADGPTLTLAGVLKADEGNYSVALTNAATSLVSSNAALTVIDPVLTTQPADQFVILGSDVTFTVAATGTALQYQWRQNGTNIPGATGPSLTISNVPAAAHGSLYSAVINNSFGVVTSSGAMLSVIAGQLVNPSINSSGLFHVRLIGIPGSNYIIQASADFTNWTPIITNSSPTGLLDFTNAVDLNIPGEFYRARLAP